MSEGWEHPNTTPRVSAITSLATELERADSDYLAGTIDRAKWIELLRGIDDKLTVAGLRLVARPWAQQGR